MIAVALLVLLASSPVRGQERLDDQLALARVCASELGLHSGATAETHVECAAIARVLRGRASSIRSGALRYSRRVFDLSRTGPRAWLVHLRPDGREPRHWPDRRVANWSYYRHRWLALYEAAGRIVRGDLVDACVEAPDHWGGAMDRARAERLGLIRIDCGPTRNDFYIVPGVRR